MAFFLFPWLRDGRVDYPKIVPSGEALEMQRAREWTPVKSSNIKAIAWRKEKGLGVWFHSGKIYWYPDAPFSEYKAITASRSKGKYLHYLVKSAYPHVGPTEIDER